MASPSNAARARAVLKEPATRNVEFERVMEREGYLGEFRYRSQSTNPFVYIPLWTDIFSGCYHTLNAVLKHLLRSKGYLNEAKVETLVHENATHLANGIMLTMYLKVRACNYTNEETLELQSE